MIKSQYEMREHSWWTKILVWCVLILVGIILVSTMLSGNLISYNYAFNGTKLASGLSVIIISGVLSLLIFLGNKISIFNQRWITILLVLGILCVTIYVSFHLRIAPVFDGKVVTSQAYDLFNHLPWRNYFHQFVNNINIVTLTYIITSPFMTMDLIHNLNDFEMLCNLIGNILLIMTIIMTTYLLLKLVSRKGVNIFLLITLMMTPMLSVFFSELYTQQIAITTLVGSFVAFYQLTSGKNRWVHGGLFLFLLAFTIVARPNMFIPYFILIGIMVVVYRTKFLKLIIWSTLAIAMLFAFNAGLKLVSEHTGYQSNSTLTEKYQLPISSWFFLAYNYQAPGRNTPQARDVLYYKQTKQEKNAYLKKQTIKAIKNAGLYKTLHLYFDKVNTLYGWRSDFSLGYFRQRIGRETSTKYNMFVTVASLLASSSFLVILVINLVIALRSLKNNVINMPWLFFNLSSLALTLFYVLIWEVQESYALPSIMLFSMTVAFVLNSKSDKVASVTNEY
ncbi:hypothetical protein H9L19_07270 [Weissella diestrammenae]|uniref:Uncharacterized protein n=1 Tax=Weissella diestrammenae TaxID=1162633 RepID=A0A7G9T4Y4_9LACO|nr:hypothetical protein [Weissella diestrammenae]MCM0582879.1 hypothetical protein [Weissella diestrammenae]QNN75159.1 hypothetical protein H9L19_07270 [Weissella diestrammenae]